MRRTEHTGLIIQALLPVVERATMTSSIARIALGILFEAPAPAPGTAVAAPQVIVFNGGPLQHRVILGDFDENQIPFRHSQLFTAGSPAPYIRPCRVDPHSGPSGLLGPCPAVRVISRDGLAILKKHGIPVAIE